MILDHELMLSEDQEETSQDTHATEEDLDLVKSNVGYDAHIAFIITEELTSSGSATLAFSVEGYDGSSWVTLAETRAIDYDDDILEKGARPIFVPVPFGSEGLMDGIERIRGAVTIGGDTLTGGKWSAYLVDHAA